MDGNKSLLMGVMWPSMYSLKEALQQTVHRTLRCIERRDYQHDLLLPAKVIQIMCTKRNSSVANPYKYFRMGGGGDRKKG